MDIYLVGGAVRDQLLGLPVKERDWVVVGATPQQLVDQGFKPVGNDFPVLILFKKFFFNSSHHSRWICQTGLVQQLEPTGPIGSAYRQCL